VSQSPGSSLQRVLAISNLFPPRVLGGYELAAANVSAGLRERGVTVRVLTTPMDLDAPPDSDWVERVLGLRTYFPLPETSGAVASYLHFESAVSRFENTKLVLDELRRFRPDVVLLFNLVGIGGIAIVDLLNRVGIPWVLNLGDNVPHQLTAGLPPDVLDVYGADPQRFFREADIVALSERLVDEIRETVPVDRVEIIPRGVKAPERARTGYRPGGTTRFAFAGSLYPNKGLDLVLDAAARLGSNRPFTIDVFGDGDLEHYRGRTSALGLDDVVHFHGFTAQDDLRERYPDFDVFLFPTWDREPFGTAPVEAAAAGCVPLLSELAGVSEWFIDGISAVKLTPELDDTERAMRRVLDEDFDLESMGTSAQRVATGVLSERSVHERLLRKLEEAASIGWRPETADSQELATELLRLDRLASDRMHAAVLRAERGE